MVSTLFESDYSQVLSPSKRNSAVVMGNLRGDAKLKVGAVDLNLYARIADSACCVVVDAAGSLLESLGRDPGDKMQNLARHRDAVTGECMKRLVGALGGAE